MQTLTSLCTVAEQIALSTGRSAPGSEHFVLSALRLPDKTAQAAFERLGISAKTFEQSIEAQFSKALESAGVAIKSDALVHDALAPGALAADANEDRWQPRNILYQTEASGQVLMKRLADARTLRSDRPLLGADVLLEVAAEEYTIAARAFRNLAISPAQLTETATQVIANRQVNSDR